MGLEAEKDSFSAAVVCAQGPWEQMRVDSTPWRARKGGIWVQFEGLMAQQRERADPSIDGNENKDWSHVALFCLVGNKRMLGGGGGGRWPKNVEKYPGVIWRGQQRGGVAAPGGGA